MTVTAMRSESRAGSTSSILTTVCASQGSIRPWRCVARSQASMKAGSRSSPRRCTTSCATRSLRITSAWVASSVGERPIQAPVTGSAAPVSIISVVLAR